MNAPYEIIIQLTFEKSFQPKASSPLYTIEAYIHVIDSLCFKKDLHTHTGQAFLP